MTDISPLTRNVINKKESKKLVKVYVSSDIYCLIHSHNFEFLDPEWPNFQGLKSELFPGWAILLHYF